MRAKSFKPRKIDPDLKYGSVKVAKLINRVMRSGKKTVAQKQVYGAFDLIKDRTDTDPLEVFESVIEKFSLMLRSELDESVELPIKFRPQLGQTCFFFGGEMAG